MAHAIDADSTPLQKLAYFMFSTLPQADAIAVTLFLIRWYAGRTKGVTMPKSLREMSLAELRTARKGWEGRTDHGSKLFLQRLDNEISHVEKHGREIADPKSGKRWGRPFGGDAVPLLDPLVLVSPVGMPLTSTDDQEAHNLRRDIAYREMLQPGMVPLVGGLSLDGYTMVREDHEANISYFEGQIRSTESQRSKRGDEETNADLMFFRSELAKEKAALAKLK